MFYCFFSMIIDGLSNIINRTECSSVKPKSCCIEIFNPLDKSYYSHVEKFDFSRPKTFVMAHMFSGDVLTAEYNPDFNDKLYDKNLNKYFDVNVLTCKSEKNPGNIIYQFMSKDLNQNYGYVWFTTPERQKRIPKVLEKDYENECITGDRLIVEYLKNYDDKNIGGVGRLADKLEVKYCLEHNIPLNIVSQAECGSHIAHYKRGKRFITPEIGTVDYNHLMLAYNNPNPNEILESVISNSNCKELDVNLGYVTMYLPKEICEKYADEIRKEAGNSL